MKRTPSTQDHLDIVDIKDDLLVLKNSVVSLVLEISSLNFELLSTGEQDAKILTFAGLLNSLSFHIQIVIRTHRTDLGDYIELLREHKKTEMSEGLRKQVHIYIEFIKNLTVTHEILDKRFFIVIPTGTGVSLSPGMFKRLFSKQAEVVNIDMAVEKAKIKLFPRRDHIVKQLKKMGLSSKQLNSAELIKLFYGIYNSGHGRFEELQLSKVDSNTPKVGAKVEATG